MNLNKRAARHAALGEEKRLQIVDLLAAGDRTVTELADQIGVRGNLLAHHLQVLEEAELIERRVSEGDHRRRYVSLRRSQIPPAIGTSYPRVDSIAFVCTANSARSQFAAALWTSVTGSEAASAGMEPAARVHPSAVRVAAEYGIDISDAIPNGYESLPGTVGLVISVCDRAREAGVPDTGETLHWSVSDPVPQGSIQAFRDSFREISERVAHLAGAMRN
jgi:protein-tyrosine-phosphatase